MDDPQRYCENRAISEYCRDSGGSDIADKPRGDADKSHSDSRRSVCAVGSAVGSGYSQDLCIVDSAETGRGDSHSVQLDPLASSLRTRTGNGAGRGTDPHRLGSTSGPQLCTEISETSVTNTGPAPGSRRSSDTRRTNRRTDDHTMDKVEETILLETARVGDSNHGKTDPTNNSSNHGNHGNTDPASNSSNHGNTDPASNSSNNSNHGNTDPASNSSNHGSTDPANNSSNNGNHGNKISLMDLFGVQLEVTNRLLDAERRKLNVLQKELEANLSHSEIQREREVEQLRTNITRIQQQYDQLEGEYENAARGLMKNTSKLRTSYRSQPAIGLKQTSKPRPTIFGTVAQGSPDVSRRNEGGPQMYMYPPSVGMAASSSHNGYHGINGHDGKQENKVYCVPQESNMGLIKQDKQSTGKIEVYKASLEKGLAYLDGNLVSGTIEALLQHIVPTAHYRPERTYIFAFLLSSRLYIKPHQLFNQVCQTCIYQQNLMADTINKEALGKFGTHFIQLLGEWTDNYPYDFQDERMMRCLKDMTQRLVAIYPELRKDVGIIMHNLISKLSGLNKYEELLARINQEVAQRLLNIMPTTDIYEVCPSPLVLAQQLTHIELERLSMIGPEEFVQAFSKESTEKDPSFKDLKKTNNLESYVHWFNRLSYFIATEICMHLKKKNRVRLIEYFIDVAKECINIGNFNSLMAIIAGLNMSPIQRLKKTWDKVNTEKFDILEHQMNPTNNFGSYRSSLKAALWRSEGAVEGRQKIVIPFFSLFVKDMYFLNEGCASKLENGQINFEKFWHLAKQISEFITWKQVDCPFDRHPPVLNYLLTNPVFSENSLSLASFECEPPENSMEKQRYKSLKEQAGL